MWQAGNDRTAAALTGKWAVRPRRFFTTKEEIVARRADHTKDELMTLVVEATGALIEEHRTVKITARQIAERIGYTAGTLYTHFENLDDIFLHVNAVSVAELRGVLERATETTESPEQALRAMGYAYLDYARAHRYRFQLMFTPRLPEGATVPRFLQAEIDALFALLAEQVVRIADDDGRALEVLVRALWSGVHGVATLSLSDQLFAATPDIERDIIDILIDQFIGAQRHRG
jgi:AcrR family transcriptional regulator